MKKLKKIAKLYYIKTKKGCNNLIKKYLSLPKNHQNIILIFAFISLFFAVLIAGGRLYLQYKITTPLDKEADNQIFMVSKGETVREIAKNLEKQGIIQNDLYFLIYYKVLREGFKNDLTLKAGKYKLSRSLNIVQVAEKLSYGLTMPENVRVTIPEGSNVFKISCILEQKNLVKAVDFIDFCSDHTLFIEDKGEEGGYNLTLRSCTEDNQDSFKNCQIPYPLEGYLFPDTYFFKKGTSIERLVKIMLDNFESKVIQKLQEDNPFQLCEENDDSSCSLLRLTTVASLLEKEVPTYYDKRIVEGIIEKRISSGMPLQIDMTVLYAKELLGVEELLKTSENPSLEVCNLISAKRNHNPVTIEDTKLMLSYNTYQSKDLPPGPINNPGFWSFKAALNPMPTSYWYYLSTKNSTTVFSSNYQQHLNNKAKYLSH